MEWFVSGDENTILGDTGLLLDDVTDAVICQSMILNNVRLGNLNLGLRGSLTSQVDHCKHDNVRGNRDRTRKCVYKTDVFEVSGSPHGYRAFEAATDSPLSLIVIWFATHVFLLCESWIQNATS